MANLSLKHLLKIAIQRPATERIYKFSEKPDNAAEGEIFIANATNRALNNVGEPNN